MTPKNVMLEEFAGITVALEAATRREDTVCRDGGVEFLADRRVRVPAGGAAIVDELRHLLAEPLCVGRTRPRCR